ncbi:MAG: hypothetical protein JKY46_01155 [Robiginitomaculum sp.]|nr:hypothetical protein [Robiginitomaculum sp.]
MSDDPIHNSQNLADIDAGALSDQELTELREELAQIIVDVKIELARRSVDKFGQKPTKTDSKADTLESVKKAALDGGSRLLEDQPDKQIYRRRADWKDPTKSHRASVNRTTKPVTVYVSKEHKDKFNALSEGFNTKREALELAIDLLEGLRNNPHQ